MATDARPTKRERREQRRQEERQRREEDARRASRNRLITIGVVVLLAAIVVALAAGPISNWLNQPSAAQGRQFANQGQDHVNPDQPHAPYNSNPPTSGPHYPDPARWGIYDQPVPDEALVHSLEHGGIVVHYNCPTGCPELVDQLKGLVGQYPSKVILAPRPNPDVPNRITLTAWTWLDQFDEFDAARIRGFVAAHKDRGPELIPD